MAIQDFQPRAVGTGYSNVPSQLVETQVRNLRILLAQSIEALREFTEAVQSATSATHELCEARAKHQAKAKIKAS